MKYNFYLLTVVLFVVMLSACSAPAQREQTSNVTPSMLEGGVVGEKEKEKNTPEATLPTAVPITSDAYPVVETTPFATVVPFHENETVIAQWVEKYHISHDDAKYSLEINNALISSGIVEALATRYPDSYAFYSMEKLGKNQEFVHFFSETVNENDVLKEARKYVKEEWMKHIKVRKVKYSMKKLQADFIELDQIFEAQILPHFESGGFIVTSLGVDQTTNSVSINVTDPDQFQLFLQENGIVLPESVRIEIGSPGIEE